LIREGKDFPHRKIRLVTGDRKGTEGALDWSKRRGKLSGGLIRSSQWGLSWPGH